MSSQTPDGAVARSSDEVHSQDDPNTQKPSETTHREWDAASLATAMSALVRARLAASDSPETDRLAPTRVLDKPPSQRYDLRPTSMRMQSRLRTERFTHRKNVHKRRRPQREMIFKRTKVKKSMVQRMKQHYEVIDEFLSNSGGQESLAEMFGRIPEDNSPDELVEHTFRGPYNTSTRYVTECRYLLPGEKPSSEVYWPRSSEPSGPFVEITTEFLMKVRDQLYMVAWTCGARGCSTLYRGGLDACQSFAERKQHDGIYHSAARGEHGPATDTYACPRFGCLFRVRSEDKYTMKDHLVHDHGFKAKSREAKAQPRLIKTCTDIEKRLKSDFELRHPNTTLFDSIEDMVAHLQHEARIGITYSRIEAVEKGHVNGPSSATHRQGK